MSIDLSRFSFESHTYTKNKCRDDDLSHLYNMRDLSDTLDISRNELCVAQTPRDVKFNVSTFFFTKRLLLNATPDYLDHIFICLSQTATNVTNLIQINLLRIVTSVGKRKHFLWNHLTISHPIRL
jgi:hypothetical protein